MHHGKLPRSLAQFAVRAFNEDQLRVLVCTSTLIEGVNTKAKNVIIFDNKVARRKFDYFTYNNIIGRSGRMFQHFVGRVFMFHEPRADELPFVDVPVLSQPDDVPESLLVQMDDADLSQRSRDRLSDISEHDSLDTAIIRQSRGIDPRAQIGLDGESVRIAREVGVARRFLCTGGKEILRGRAIAMHAQRQRKALGNEVLRDPVAHQAHADETNPWLTHVATPSLAG